MLGRYVSLHVFIIVQAKYVAHTHARSGSPETSYFSASWWGKGNMQQIIRKPLKAELTTYLSPLSQSQAQQRNAISLQRLRLFSQPQVIENPSKLSFLFPCSLLRVPVLEIWIWDVDFCIRTQKWKASRGIREHASSITPLRCSVRPCPFPSSPGSGGEKIKSHSLKERSRRQINWL